MYNEYWIIQLITIIFLSQMMAWKTKKTTAQLEKEFIAKHGRPYGGGVSGSVLLPPEIQELCVQGGMPAEDWVALMNDPNDVWYALPQPVYYNQHHCKTCGVEIDNICLECPRDAILSSEDVEAAWHRAGKALGDPAIGHHFNSKPADNAEEWFPTLGITDREDLELFMHIAPVWSRINPNFLNKLSAIPRTELKEVYITKRVKNKRGKSVTKTATIYVLFVSNGASETENPYAAVTNTDEAEESVISQETRLLGLINDINKEINPSVDAPTKKLSKKATMKANRQRLEPHRRR
jgi:hypothetical protein